MNNNEKKAILLPGLLGAGIGAAASPEGQYGAGAIHGAGRGIGLDVGAGVGGVAGGLAGLGIGAGLSNVVPEKYKGLAMLAPTAVGALGGAGLGGYGGYHAGAGIAKGITGKKAPWQQTAKKKPAPKKKPVQDEDESEPAKKAASAQKLAAVMNDSSLSLSQKAEKAAGFLWDDKPTVDARPMMTRESRPSGLPVDPDLLKHEQQNTIAGRLGVSGNVANAGMGALAGGAAGAMLGRKNRLRNAALGAALGGAGTYIGSHLAHGGNVQSMLHGLGLGSLMGKTSSEKSAFDFGKMLGDAGTYAKDLYNKVPAGVMQGAGMGGLGGAALGGLAGLVAPGEEDEYDDEGNLVGRKQRNRLGAALRGLLGGGLAGGLAGGAAGHFAPEMVNSVYGSAMGFGGDLARRMGFRGKSDTAVTPTTAASMQSSLPGDKPIKNPLYQGPNTANMQTPTSSTYTSTDTAAVAARRAQAAAAEQAKFERLNRNLVGPQAYDKQKNQMNLDEAVGVSNASPELLAFKQRDPAGFARMMQEVRDKQIQENVQSAPNRGFDMSNVDTSKMTMPTSATMGR